MQVEAIESSTEIVTSEVSKRVIPVVPGLYGFGAHTPAGRGGKVYRVTSLADEGVGSLRWALEQKGPIVVVFEVSGIIRIKENLNINEPYVTIAGQTAPSPGIMIAGASLVITSHDVLVQHIRIRAGDDPEGPPSTDRDCIIIAAQGKHPTNIVIDHCTFNWSLDEAGSTWYDVGDISFNLCNFSEPLDESFHIDEGSDGKTTDPHGFNFISGYGSADARLSIVGTLFAHSRERNPMSISPTLVFVNNVVYNSIYRMTHLHNREGFASKNSIVGNVYLKGPSSDIYNSRKPITISEEFYQTSRLYVEDNLAPDFEYSNQWELVANESAINMELVKSKTLPVWVDGLKAMTTSQDKVLNWVLDNCGARPADRDLVEKRIINDVRNRTGLVKNSVEEAGGWPEYKNNKKTLILPLDPNGDIDGDGYTNLEEWLHDYSYEVEGRMVSKGDYQMPVSAVPLQNFPQLYEAEEAFELSSAIIENYNTGYSREGYVNFEPNLPGGYISWRINAPKEAIYRIEFRFSNAGNIDRPADIRVNGTTKVTALSFKPTSSWTQWETATAVVELKKGENDITLVSNSSEGGPNIDYLKIYAFSEDNSAEIFIDSKIAAIEKGMGAPYIDQNNRTQVPVRWLAGILGTKLDFDQKTGEITLLKGDTKVVFTIGSNIYYVNGFIKAMDTIAYLSPLEFRTYVPIRFVTEPFNYRVNYVRNTGQILDSLMKHVILISPL